MILELQLAGDELVPTDATDFSPYLLKIRQARPDVVASNLAGNQITNFIKPGLTENEVAAFGFEKLYAIPGMEDVEDVIVSSGLNTWPNWRNFSDRIKIGRAHV